MRHAVTFEFVAIRELDSEVSYAIGEGGKWQSSQGWRFIRLIKIFEDQGYKILSPKIKTEIDYLNAIQNNFREGV